MKELKNLNTSSNKKIAILGAGPMGLAAAYYLIKKGYKPHIYEFDDRVGGMTACFNFRGLQIERFYHFHCTSDDAYFEILKDFNLLSKFHWVKTKMGFYFGEKLQDWGNPLALLKFKGITLTEKIRYALHAFYSVNNKSFKDLDEINAISWLKKWLGESVYKKLWEKLLIYKFYNLSDQISAAWIWARIRRIGRSRFNLMNEKLGYLEGGSQTLLLSLESFIKKNGGQIFLKTPVQKVALLNRSVSGIYVKNNFIEYDEVISTIPITYIPKIIPDLPQMAMKKFSEIKNVAVVCVIVKLSKPVTKYFWVNVNDENMDIPGFIEYSNLMPLDNSIVYVPFYMPQEVKMFNDNNEVFIEKVKKYLTKINPNLIDNDFIDIHVSRYKYAQPVCPPNFLSMLPDISCGIKNLKVADTSYYYPEDRGISESIKFAKKYLV